LNLPDLAPDTGLDAVAHVLDGADETHDVEKENLAWLARLSAKDPMPGFERDGIMAGDWEPDQIGLPPDCPVICLGVDGDAFWFLDTLGQLRRLMDEKFSQNKLNALFMGRHLYLYWAWPRRDKEGIVVGWRAEKCRETLMLACARKGPWNNVERAKGRGAWALDSGQLALHCGTELFVDGKPMGLGELNGDVYMTRPPILQPWKKPMTKGPASYLYPLLQTWNWARPEIDPILFLGWLGASLIGGALPWRPVIYMTGDKATGKSTLQRLMKMLLGNYQLLKSDALPVAVDELEGKADARKAKAILELARLAASGDLMLRGGSEHSGVQFNARSCFAFSSINTPPLEPQDLSRMALLRLYKLPQDSIPPELDPAKCHKVGRMILKQMMEGWTRFPVVWKHYRKLLARAGHDSRGQDTFGTLLACADILTGTQDAGDLRLPFMAYEPDGETLIAQFAAADMVEYEDAEDNWRLGLNRILSTHIEAWKGGAQRTMGQVLESLYAGRMDFEDAKLLAQVAGMSLCKPTKDYPYYGLFVPNQHPELQKLFIGHKLYGEPGAGVWSGALRQAPPGTYRLGQGRVTGVKGKGTLFDLHVVLNRQPRQVNVTPVQEEMEKL
jgi:hypothetical protein